MKQNHKFGKERRAWNNPVSNPPKGREAYLPLPPKNKTDLTLELETILPGINDEIKKTGKLVFHVVGDTGGIHGTETQESLAAAMESQLVSGPEQPRFLYHLGDVVYFNGQPDGYQSQFYEPYQHLDYPIFAIPGNHDCGGDPKLWAKDGANDGTAHPLKGFMDNFCSPRAENLFKHRTTMTQPYCYWTLKTPLFSIIGLNANVDGLLDPPGTTEQLAWLKSQMVYNTERPLIAVHHPPYSLDANHGGYQSIVDALSEVRDPAGVFTGHVHNYQRFSNGNIPYVVAGAGGYANTAQAMHKMSKEIKDQRLPLQTSVDGLKLVEYNTGDPGFLRITATFAGFTAEYFTVPFGTEEAHLFDTFTF
jgi:hypothetical protein